MTREIYGPKRKSLLRRMPFTYWLIGINTILFVLLSIVFAVSPELSRFITLQAGEVIQGRQIWTVFTSMLWHHGIFHLLVNMFTLFFLGLLCEQIIGRKRFIEIYFASGIFAAAFFVLFAYLGSFVAWGESVFGGLNVPAAGASGALFGILGVLVMIVPRYKVYLIIGPLIAFILLVILSRLIPEPYSLIFSVAMNIIIFFMIFAMFSRNRKIRAAALPMRMNLWMAPIAAIVPLVIISFFVTLPIGNTAHFGGLLVGLAYGTYLRLKYSNKARMLGRIFR